MEPLSWLDATIFGFESETIALCMRLMMRDDLSWSRVSRTAARSTDANSVKRLKQSRPSRPSHSADLDLGGNMLMAVALRSGMSLNPPAPITSVRPSEDLREAPFRR